MSGLADPASAAAGTTLGHVSSWPSRHFSLSNPREDGASDLPRLLRRLADAMEEAGIGAMEMLDLNVHHEMTEDGPWWSGTVYWSPDTGDA